VEDAKIALTHEVRTLVEFAGAEVRLAVPVTRNDACRAPSSPD
jgi:hypothetical protein